MAEHNGKPDPSYEEDFAKRFKPQLNKAKGDPENEDTAFAHGQPSLRKDLLNAENSAAAGAAPGGNGVSTATREQSPSGYYKPTQDAKATAAKEIEAGKQRSLQYRQSGGRRRGILIGVGAGGGLLSIVAGFMSMMSIRLPGIMDTLVGDSGKRVEKIIERRAERVLLVYILRGSSVALKNGNVITTGNYIGDLFANIRTSNFEKNLKATTGLEFAPGPNKTVRLIHNGASLGDVKNVEDILKILESGGSLSRSDMRKVVRTQIPAWQFWKVSKFKKWLSLKYNVPRWGPRDMEPDEKEEEYNQSVKKDHIVQVETTNIENMTDFIDCIAEKAGDCPNKTGAGEEMAEDIKKAIEQSADELAKTGTNKATETVATTAIKKLILAGALGATGIGTIDMAARMVHGLGEVIEGDLLQRKHAEYIKNSSAQLAISYAGAADKTKAGEMPASTVSMFTTPFDGWEESASYGVIQSHVTNTPQGGKMLDPLEQVNETNPPEIFSGFVKTMFGTVGWIGRAPLEAWYYTVSQVLDLLGGVIEDAVGWIIEHTPAKLLIEQLAPVMADIFQGLMRFVGMYIDPLALGAKLAMYIHQGFLAAFNGKAEEDGFRELSEAQGLVVDAQIREERIADLQDEPLYNRVFDATNSNSLAHTLMTTMPSTLVTNPITSLAAGSARLVAGAPYNLARATSGTAHAAPTRTSESLFGIKILGGFTQDMDAELDSGVMDNNKTCPDNDPNQFNHCKVDRQVVDGMRCVFIKCSDMYDQPTADGGKDYLFAHGAEGPLYGPDAVPQDKPTSISFDWVKTAGGLLASFLPLIALELSRRRA